MFFQAEERTRQRNEQLDTLTLNLNVITKAVLFCEAERFQNERAISIKNLVGLLLSIQCEVISLHYLSENIIIYFMYV